MAATLSPDRLRSPMPRHAAIARIALSGVLVPRNLEAPVPHTSLVRASITGTMQKARLCRLRLDRVPAEEVRDHLISLGRVAAERE